MEIEKKIVDGVEKEIVRWDTKKKYSKKELEQQRKEFTEKAKEGKVICLTDLMINHGM